EDRPGLGRLERRELLERGRCTVVVDLDVGEQCGVGAAGADRREVVLCELDGLVHLLSGLGQCLFNHGSLFPSLYALGSFYGSSLKNAAPYPQPSVLTCADSESAVEAAAMGGAVSAPSGPRGSPAGPRVRPGSPGSQWTTVPILSPVMAFCRLPSPCMPKTCIGSRLSMHSENAVESTTLSPRCSASW